MIVISTGSIMGSHLLKYTLQLCQVFEQIQQDSLNLLTLKFWGYLSTKYQSGNSPRALH